MEKKKTTLNEGGMKTKRKNIHENENIDGSSCGGMNKG